MTLTIPQLESALGQSDPLTAPDLLAIRRAGTRRRRLIQSGVVAGTFLTITALGALAASIVGHEDPAPLPPMATPSPHALSRDTLGDLARRVIDEIPGATQVSDTDVVIPAGGARSPFPHQDIEVTSTRTLPADAIYAVDQYRRADLPEWLYEEVQQRNTSGSFSVLMPRFGVGVDQGKASIGCVHVVGFEEGSRCAIAILFKAQGRWALEGWFWSESFIDGRNIQVVNRPSFQGGRQSTLWIGGRRGTDVATADFMLADGTRVPATVDSGQISQGNTLFWAQSVEDVTGVVVRDAAGNVIEDHHLKPCSSSVECEVR